MSPRKEIPDEEPELSRSELQRIRKQELRRARGLPEPSELAEQVSVSLWFHRQLNHLSQQQLAERLGMKQPQVARLESGFVSPSFDTLIRISEKLGIEIKIEVKRGVLTATARPPGRFTPPGNRPA